jgi:hypothetical protein
MPAEVVTIDVEVLDVVLSGQGGTGVVIPHSVPLPEEVLPPDPTGVRPPLEAFTREGQHR